MQVSTEVRFSEAANADPVAHRSHVGAMLTQMAERFDNPKQSVEKLRLMADDFAGLDLETLALAFVQHVRTSDFFPSTAQVYRNYFDIRVPDRHAESAEWVRNRMVYTPDGIPCARPKPDEYPDMLTMMTVQSLGWRRLFDIPANRFEFEYARAYEHARAELYSEFARNRALELGR